MSSGFTYGKKWAGEERPFSPDGLVLAVGLNLPIAEAARIGSEASARGMLVERPTEWEFTAHGKISEASYEWLLEEQRRERTRGEVKVKILTLED